MKLSERQTYILLELARGQSKKMIAKDLGTSRTNVENIITRIRKRVNCSNVTHLVAFCISNGYISLDGGKKHTAEVEA